MMNNGTSSQTHTLLTRFRSAFHLRQRANDRLTLAYDATLEAWCRALEMRTHGTVDHLQHVTDMTVRLARTLSIGEDKLVHVRRGALLHDIGEMYIPDAILLKEGPLLPSERILMRQHPQYAYELLSPIEYLRPALVIPYCHHEKWDGTGYPRGLHGADIPLEARIFAVVDTWDVLRTERSYRSAWSDEKTWQYLNEQVNTEFDPAVVKAFGELLSPQ